MAIESLGTIAQIIMGQSPAGETCNVMGNGLPLLNGPTEFGSHHPTPVQYTTDTRKRAKSGDILFCVRGSTTGRMNWANREYAIGRGIAAIRHKRGQEFQQFLRALIDYQLPGLLAQATGSTFPNVSSDQLSSLRCDVLDPGQQHAISSVFGMLDDKIELNRRMNETLEALAQSLFKSWFVDATQSALPKGWTTRALYDCADYINGAAFRNEHFSTERQGLPVIKIGELKDGITEQTKFCEIERESKYRIKSGAILFSWSGSPDTSIDIFIWTEGEGWLNQHIFKIQFKRPIEKFFVYYLLRHLKPVFIEIARDKQTTGLGHVTGQDLKRLKTFFPTDDVLEKFNRVVEPLFQKVYSNLHESRTLAALRDALLPKLLSGELRVSADKTTKDTKYV
jgi:type I restriction enzyme S subunit